MKVLIALLALAWPLFVCAAPVALVVHGGAGALPRAELTPAKERAILKDLTLALRTGHALLLADGSALDAVTAAVRVLEDSPHFNAGRGAVYNFDGKHELDAAIMEGHTLRAGAVSGVRTVKNPINLARAVMEHSPHVMLVGEGAEMFAKSQAFKPVDPSYFKTETRWQQYLKAKAQAAATSLREVHQAVSNHTGTVGAVALDRSGHLAAATSTGGMLLKRFGRVGDAPIIGAGTYANKVCAVSATGWGEFYIRATVAHDICARMEYQKVPLQAAADEVVLKIVPALGGDGGVIALDQQGHIAMPYNTGGMYRGSIDSQGKLTVLIYQK